MEGLGVLLRGGNGHEDGMNRTALDLTARVTARMLANAAVAAARA